MKMAKASKADLEMAIDLCRALDTLTQRWCPAVPEECEKGVDEDAIESFDRDDAEQCQRVLGYLLDVAGRASLFRVVWNCVVMLDPTNRCVDPDADTIEHHPDVKDAARYRMVRRGQRWSVIDGIGNDLRADALDAAIDALEAEMSQPAPAAKTDADKAVDAFMNEVRAELVRARAKFPGDRIMCIALAEEFGELCKAVLDESRANVRKEAVQTAVMAARVALDGDSSVGDWRAERGLDALVDGGAS